MNTVSYVFVVQSGNAVLFHPFYTGSSIFSSMETRQLAGRYGAGFETGKTDELRKNLLKAAEKNVRGHFLEKGYYVRLALSALAFVAVYLFFSIVVRDLVPVIDELLVGTLAAILVNLLCERQVLNSQKYLDAVGLTRRSLDTSYFDESTIVSLVETWCEQVIALGPAAFYGTGVNMDSIALTDAEKAEARSFCSLCVQRWKRNPLVTGLYGAMIDRTPPGRILDRMERRMGLYETALVVAYLRLLSYIPEPAHK